MYVHQCRQDWSKYWKKREMMSNRRSYLPVKENHVLSGIPLHMSSTDLKEIRKNLLNCEPIQEYYNLMSDDVLFFVCAKVFPMPSSVNSVWMFVGGLVPLSQEKVQEIAQENMQKFMEEDNSDESAPDVEIIKKKKEKKDNK